MNKKDREELLHLLSQKAKMIRKEILRLHKIAPETRVASSLSPVETFSALYYGGLIKHFPNSPLDPNRDRLILSKGHGSIFMYPILADLGYFPKSKLNDIGQDGSFLGTIPDPVIPGFETINGSLGHGLGVSCGIAIALKADKKDNHVFVLCGDGEMYEGSNWEAIMFAAHHKLNNLILILDFNRVSMLDFTSKIIDQEPIADKFQSFGWHVDIIDDGHNVENCLDVLESIVSSNIKKPKIIISKTIKGKGVSSLEGQSLSHILSVKTEEIDSIIQDM